MDLRSKVDFLYKKWLERPAEEEALSNYSTQLANGSITPESLEKELQSCIERQNLIKNRAMINRFIPRIKNVKQFSHLVTGDSCKGLRIRYYGPIGKTGYCQAAKAYFYSLFTNGADLTFSPLQYHTFTNEYTPSERDLVLYNHIGRIVDYDIVIIHSVPDAWQRCIENERLVNPRVKIVGLTVWETDKIHPQWSNFMNMTDLIITPCEWNQHTFSRDVKVPVFTVHNPIDGVADPDESFELGNLDNEELVFYTINEWTARKGTEDLITCFLESFTKKDKVCLYIKAATISFEKASKYIEEKRALYQNPPAILLETRDLSDNQISSIHKRSHVYVSLCKSEGTGLGACEATLWGNPVIMTGFGGQLDYLKGIFYVSCSTESPNMCNSIQQSHASCSEDRCKVYPWYMRDQKWGTPSLDDARRTMRFVYENYDLSKRSVLASQLYMKQNLSFQQIGTKLANVLQM